MPADVLTSCIIRPFVAKALAIQDNALGFHQEGFQPPVASYCWEMTVNTIFLTFFKKNEHYKGQQYLSYVASLLFVDSLLRPGWGH